MALPSLLASRGYLAPSKLVAEGPAGCADPINAPGRLQRPPKTTIGRELTLPSQRAWPSPNCRAVPACRLAPACRPASRAAPISVLDAGRSEHIWPSNAWPRLLARLPSRRQPSMPLLRQEPLDRRTSLDRS